MNSSEGTFAQAIAKSQREKNMYRKNNRQPTQSLDGLVTGFDQFIVDLSRSTFATPTGGWCGSGKGRRTKCGGWTLVVDRGGSVSFCAV